MELETTAEERAELAAEAILAQLNNASPIVEPEALSRLCRDIERLVAERATPLPEEAARLAAILETGWSSPQDQRLAASLLSRWPKEAGWQPISTAPKDGTIIDVWLGEDAITSSDLSFYCTPGTRRSTNWHWQKGKFRPFMGLEALSTFVVPTHWMPLPPAPKEEK